MPDLWKAELNAIVGARHGGAGEAVLSRLRFLDTRFPNVAEIHYQIAWSCEAVGHLKEARESYERAIVLGLNPHEHAGALVGLGSCHLREKDAARAERVFRDAQRLFPENREFDAFLALAMQALGRHNEATQILLAVLAETSEDAGITAYQRQLRHLATLL